MAVERRCLLCNGAVRYNKRYSVLQAGDDVVEIACLMRLIKKKGWKVIKRGTEPNKDKLPPKKRLRVKQNESRNTYCRKNQ